MWCIPESPAAVAKCYYKALSSRLEYFDCVAFAIFYPGYGQDNFPTFAQQFG